MCVITYNISRYHLCGRLFTVSMIRVESQTIYFKCGATRERCPARARMKFVRPANTISIQFSNHHWRRPLETTESRTEKRFTCPTRKSTISLNPKTVYQKIHLLGQLLEGQLEYQSYAYDLDITEWQFEINQIPEPRGPRIQKVAELADRVYPPISPEYGQRIIRLLPAPEVADFPNHLRFLKEKIRKDVTNEMRGLKMIPRCKVKGEENLQCAVYQEIKVSFVYHLTSSCSPRLVASLGDSIIHFYSFDSIALMSFQICFKISGICFLGLCKYNSGVWLTIVSFFRKPHH